MAQLQKTDRPAVSLLFSANIVIAIIQFNIASVYSLLAVEFHAGVSGLGFAGSAMFLGIFVSEVPGGILETKLGARNAMVYSMLFASISTLLAAAASNFQEILAFRFLAGVGIGASFPPTVMLIISKVRAGSGGLAVGMLSSSYNLGGVIGLLGWAILGILVGWRQSLLLSGALCLMLACLIYFRFPKTEIGFSGVGLGLSEVWSAISSNRRLLLVTVALFGIGASATLNWNFEVYFLETSLGLKPAIAGLIAASGPLLAVSAPLVGRLYDKIGRSKIWLASGAALVCVGVAVTSFDTVVAGVISSLLVGIGSSMSYTVGLSTAREAGKLSRIEHQSIAVGFADAVALLGGFVSPIIFSYVVLESGYRLAWISGSLFALILVLPFLGYQTRK